MNTANMLGVLLIANINDHAMEGCCPDCCAPCSVIRDLLNEPGELDYFLRFGVEEIGGGWTWWNDETGTVDADWLRSRWSCQSKPPCEDETVG